MSQSQTAGLFGHRNHSLFSDYYLDNRVAQRPEWGDPATRSAAAALLTRLRALWQSVGPFLAAANEAQTEDRWVRPVLDALGHPYAVQVSLQTAQGVKTPDYLLCPDGASRDRLMALGKPATDGELAGNLAVADAKAWDRPLDRAERVATRGIKTLHEHPGLQIDTYIRYSGLAWGVLTNGRLWRIYHSESSKKLDVFYEVDLPALLEQNDPAAFHFFYLFFRPQALAPGGWLESVLERSQSYGRGVSETLKSQVYDALTSLAQGFLDFPGNRLHPTPENRKAIYDNSLIVLYRLLFVLYAESRKLLPVDVSDGGNETYRDNYSFLRLKEQVAQELDSGRSAAPTMTDRWDKLRNLWGAIDQGNDYLGVHPYNGGLFSPTVHPFLERYKVGDLHLRQAIDKLARTADPETGHPAFVDYRDLEIRHLGSIYEGLLEYQLQIADDPPPATRHSQLLTLITDKGERKATGSYYTPDYIVQYIVEQTVGPVIDGLADSHADDPGALARAVLAVNVLDPAMGSGHFLVAAADYMARRLVELGARPPGRNTGADEAEMDRAGELAYWRRRVVQGCIYGVDLNHLAVELAKLSLWLATVAKDKPLSFLDHHLRHGNSLIGAQVVDLNWGGEAHKGAKQRQRAQQKEAERRQAGQISMLDDSAFVGSLRTATRFMTDIEALNSDTLDDVKEAERIYLQTVRATTQGLRDVADVWTARHFGLAVDDVTLMWLSKQLALGSGFQVPKYQEIVEEARRMAAAHRFFHWELEFPEVFFDDNGQVQASAGFDAVIGNPPYVRQEQMAGIKPYLADAHSAVYDGTADLYVYFYKQGVELLRAGSALSYIVTNKWMRAGYGEKLRGFFAEEVAVDLIVDFGHAPIFADADTFPCIVVVRKAGGADGQAKGNEPARICIFPRELLGKVTLAAYVDSAGYSVPASRFSAQAWSLERADVEELMAKIRRNGIPLTEFTGSQPYRGILTGFNQAFLIDTEAKDRLVRAHPACGEILKPYLRGQDIKRWTPAWAGLWMIVLKSSENHEWPWSNAGEQAEAIFAATFPSIYAYFKPLEDRLRQRQDQGRFWWELRSCAYYDAFEKPKIVHTDITWRPEFALSPSPMFLVNTAYLWPTDDLYLLSVVNSPLIWSYMWRNATHGKDEALRIIYSFVATLPIAVPSDEIREQIESKTTRLLTLSGESRQQSENFLEWLRFEFGIEKLGRKIDNFSQMTEKEFLIELRLRTKKNGKALSPAKQEYVRSTFRNSSTGYIQKVTAANELERTISELVCDVYGLSKAEKSLLWTTAPPRMPFTPAD